MIISKKKYKEMCELIVQQRSVIRLLEIQNDLIKKSALNTFYGSKALHDIDFPATEKLHEDKIY